MHPRQLQRFLIGGTGHNLGGAALKIGRFDIVPALYMQRIGQPKSRLCTHPQIIGPAPRRIAVFVPDSRRKVLLRVLRIERLNGNREFRLIHGVHQIAQDLFRTAAGEGLDKKENVDHRYRPPS